MSTKGTKGTEAKAISMKLIKGATAIKDAIASIQRRGKKLDRDIHIAGCSCIQHIEEHGDITLATRLIDAMPKGSRVNALREWFEVHAKMKYNEETKEWQYSKDKATLLEEAIATPWTEFKPEPAYKPIDFEADLKKIIAKAYARVDSDKGDSINTELLKQVAKLTGYTPEV